MGKIRVIKTAQGLDTPRAYYIGRRQFAVDNPGVLRIVIEEIDKIQRWAEAHTQETAKLIAPYQKLPPDIMQRRNSDNMSALPSD